MAVEKSIAWRFLLRGTEKGRFSAMTFFAWLAIAVGVWAMSSFLSVMYGFESSLKSRVLKAYPHVIVKPKSGSLPVHGYSQWTKALKEVDGVARVMPYVEEEMIVQSSYRTLGAVVWGIPPEDLVRLKPETVEGVVPDRNAKVPQVLVGRELARRLDSDKDSEIRLISPIERGGALGLVPRSRTFSVSGIYMSGHYDFDQQYLFMVMEDAQELMKLKDAISGWHVWATSLADAERVQKNIQEILPDSLQAQSWTVFNSALFHSLQLEQYSMFVILSFAIVIAVMNVVITLMMHVTQKRKNIGILRALGASREQVRKIFVWQGAWLGGVGLLGGAIATVIFIVYLRYSSTYLLPEIYYDRSIPVEIRPLSLLLIYLLAITCIYLATLYPASRAAKLNPLEAIRE